jgi:hypothetical protein
LPDTKISADPDAGTLDGTEIVPVVSGGANERTTTQAIANLAAGGGAVSLISTLTASASATLDFTGLSGTTWKLIGRLLVPASAVGMWLRFGTGAGPTWSSAGYRFSSMRMSSNGLLNNSSGEAQAQLPLDNGIGTNNATPGMTFDFTISTDNANFVNITGNVIFRPAAGNDYGGFLVGGWATSGPLTGIRMLASSGNLASGTLSLYAVDD